MPRRVRGQSQPDGSSLIVRDELLPGGELACDECGEPATVFHVPVKAMEIIYRDLRIKSCAVHGVVIRLLRSFREVGEAEYRELEEWPPVSAGGEGSPSGKP